MKTKNMILCALFAAILCVFCVITIPIGPVPVTLATFGIMLTAIILGSKKSAVSILVYILLGAVGLPVFSGFKGGVQVLFGPTGGYLWSYVFMALFIGFLISKLPENKYLAMLKIFIAALGGMVICYALGTAQFMLVQRTDVIKALSLCVIPFIPLDIVKAVIASYVGFTVKKQLIKTGILE